MSRFLNLAPELEQLVLSKLCEPDGPVQTLKNASLVCKAWHHIFAPLLFQQVQVELIYNPNQGWSEHIEFLQSNPRIRSYIRELRLWQRYASDVCQDAADALTGLLPLLTQLQHVHIHINRNGDNYGPTSGEPGFDFLYCHEWRDSFFNALRALDKKISVSYHRYIHPIDHNCALLSPLLKSESSCNTSGVHPVNLEVSLLDQHGWDQPEPPVGPFPWPTVASRDVDELLRQCSTLTRLHLDLESPTHPDHERERQHALECISLGLPLLKRLSLQGEMLVSDKAWSNWALFPWGQLEELALTHPVLISQFGTRFESSSSDCSFSRLRVLRLSADNGDRDQTPQSDEMPCFALGLGVPNLYLDHFLPAALVQYLHHDVDNARNLLSVCLYGRGPQFQLSADQVTELTRCPRLSWLGINYNEEMALADSEPTSSSKLLDAIAALRPLQHLNFYMPQDPGSTREPLELFRYIRTRKKGCELLSMEISYASYGNRYVTMWAWGQGNMYIETGYPPSLEVWSEKEMLTIEDCATHWTRRTINRLGRTRPCVNYKRS